MPSKSPEQRRFMSAVAHNPAFAKKVGVPTAVGKEFARADRAKGYSTQAMVNRPNTAHGKLDMPFHSVKTKAQGGNVMKESKGMMKKEIAFMQKKGAPKSMIRHEKAEAGMKKGGATKKYAFGGVAGRPAATGLARAGAMSGRAMPTVGRPAGMKNGGGVFRRSADGVAQRGKTKGKMLRKGGSC